MPSPESISHRYRVTADDPGAAHRWQEPYVLSKPLADAVNLALALGKPLLVSGDPGTGKTTLAARVAEELGLGPVLPFNTKSSSQATDLFYQYDTVRRFGETQLKALTQEALPAPEAFLRLDALGKAIAYSLGPDAFQSTFGVEPPQGITLPRKSVVLIDEVDKAPRDFPNDLLNELERHEFAIPEIQRSEPIRVPRAANGRHPDPAWVPLVLITTNRETQLPEAFLRRCLYLHLELPSSDDLHRIVALHLQDRSAPPTGGGTRGGGASDALRKWIEGVVALRDNGNLEKAPSTAEFIDGARALRWLGWDGVSDVSRELGRAVASTLFKTQADLACAYGKG